VLWLQRLLGGLDNTWALFEAHALLGAGLV